MSKQFDVFSRLLDSAVRNMAQSFYDDFVQTNCKTRVKVGLAPKIIRRDDGHCCEWCANLAGTYEYGDHPADIFRRHKNCTCTVIAKYDKNRYQDVYSKKEFEKERDARINQAKHEEELDKLSRQERIDRTARLDAEYSRNYRKNMTASQREKERIRQMGKYHEKNPDAKYLSRYKDVVNSYNKPATLNGKVGKELEEAINKKYKGLKPDFYVGEKAKALKAEYSEWIGKNRMNEYLEAAEEEITKNYIRADFRKTSFIGDGSTADIREFEKATGLNCGRNGGNHKQKIDDLIRQINKSLLKVKSDNDKIFLEKMLKRLLEVAD